MLFAASAEVTGISGTFSDSNNGQNIVNAAISALVPIRRDTLEATNLLALRDVSRFAVTGLPPEGGGFLTYDKLFYLGRSPPTACDYPMHGGFLDIYGLLFDIGGFWSNGNLWSDGDFSGTGAEQGLAFLFKRIA